MPPFTFTAALAPIRWVMLLLALSLTASAQKLPARKSSTDKSGQRQGEWVIWFNASWKETETADSAQYFRRITYFNDLPSGTVRDFYLNGKTQWEGKLLKDRPKSVYEGEQSWYYNSGQERLRVEFANGAPVKLISAWRRDGSQIIDSWDEPAKQAENESDVQKRMVLYTQAKDNAEAYFTDKSIQYATQADNLAYEYWGIKDFEKAARSFRTAADLYRKLLDPKDERITDALEMLANAYMQSGDKGLEQNTYKEYLNLVEQHHNGYLPGAMDAWASLGNLLMNEPEQAETCYENGLELLKTNVNSGEEYERGITLILGYQNFLLDTKQWQKMAVVNETCRKIAERWEGQISEIALELLKLRRITERGLGNGAELKKIPLQQYELTMKLYPPDDYRVAEALIALAESDELNGDPASAERHLLEAKSIFEKNEPLRHQGYGTTLTRLLEINHAFNREDRENGYATAYGEFLKASLGETSGLLTSHHLTRGMHELQAGRLKDAERELHAAENLIIALEAGGNESKNTIRELKGLQELYGAMLKVLLFMQARKTDAAGSLTMLDQAEKQINKAISLMDALDRGADLQLLLGFAKMLSADFESADRLWETGGKGRIKLYGEKSPEYAEVLSTRANLHKQMNDHSGALKFYTEAFRIYRDYTNTVVTHLSETERQAFYNKLNSYLQAFMVFAFGQDKKIPEAAGDLYDAILLSKGAGLDYLKEIRLQLVTKKDAEGLALLGEWKSLKEELVALYRNQDNPSAVARKKQLEDQINETERKLAGRIPTLRTLESKNATDWSKVCAALKPDEAAVEMLRVEDLFSDNAFYIALLLKAGSTKPLYVLLPNARALENRNLRYYHNAIRNQLTDTLSYRVFWEPIGKALGQVKKIYLSPDGLYNQLNPETFFNPATSKYVADEVSLQLLTTSRQILHSTRTETLREVILMGNPDFGLAKNTTSAMERTSDFSTVTDLPGTRKEIEYLSQFLSRNKIRQQTFTQKEANEVNIRGVTSPQVLHLATHGFFLKDVEKKQGNGSELGFMAGHAGENPMLRSGILLAGCRAAANGTNQLSTSDGVLTAFEASNINLSGTQLVVMSACETGLGTVINGEGVLGLPRALQSAGSQRVLMSLWKVDDEATQELMTSFYTKWTTSGNPDSAWSQAQKELRIKYPSPFHWGAFVMIR